MRIDRVPDFENDKMFHKSVKLKTILPKRTMFIVVTIVLDKPKIKKNKYASY